VRALRLLRRSSLFLRLFARSFALARHGESGRPRARARAREREREGERERVRAQAREAEVQDASERDGRTIGQTTVGDGRRSGAGSQRETRTDS